MNFKSLKLIVIPFFVLLAPFVGTALVVPYLIDHYEGLSEVLSVQQQVLIFGAASLVIGFGLFPSTLTAIVLGFFYGWKGIVLMSIIYMVASMIGYFVAHQNKVFFQELFRKRKKVGVAIEALKNRPFLFIVLLRISPVLPFAWGNYLLGVLEIPFRTYFSATFLGMMPRTILAVMAGKELVDLVDVKELNHQAYYKIIGVLLLLLSSLGLGFIGKNILNKVNG